MIRRPPRSTRTDTLFPYTTLFRSSPATVAHAPGVMASQPGAAEDIDLEELVPERIVDLEEFPRAIDTERSEEHTSELQSLMRISYAVFCLKKKTNLTLLYNTHSHTTTMQYQ